MCSKTIHEIEAILLNIESGTQRETGTKEVILFYLVGIKRSFSQRSLPLSFYSIIQYSVINYTYHVYIRFSDLVHLIAESIYLLPTFPCFSHPPTLGNHFPTLCFSVLVMSCSICLCLAYFIEHNACKFHSCCCKWQHCILSHESVFMVNNFPWLCIYTTPFLLSHPLTDT